MAPNTLLANLMSRAVRAWNVLKPAHREDSELTAAVERVVSASAPAIGTLRDCRRDLQAPVASALEHISRSLAAIPGPIRLAPEAWDRDPALTALFVGPDEVESLLATDPRLKSFFRSRPISAAAGLLLATKRERSIFGTAVEGGLVQRDVALTAVEFYDHRLLALAATEAESRRELRDRALNALVDQVLERLMQRRALQDDLKAEQRILSLKLKILQTRPGLEVLRSEEGASEADASGGRQVLADIERQIREISAESDSPRQYLRQLADVLSAPEKVLAVTPVAMRLDRMGFKQCDTSNACALEARLAEVELKDRLKRVAVFVTITRTGGAAP